MAPWHRWSNLATKTTLNAKINEVKGEVPSITNLATTTALTAVENKNLMLTIQLKKTNCTTKINEIQKKISDRSQGKYITTPEFDILTAENVDAGLAQANLLTKAGFDDKLNDLNKKKLTQAKQNMYLFKINY